MATLEHSHQSQIANNRLQPAQITVSNSQIGTFSDHAYTYQPTGQINPSNNGNIYSIADQLKSSLTQTFTYDKLNRLATATESRWGLSFVYDPWGNFLQQNQTAGTVSTRVDIVNNQNQLTGRQYDLSGNTLNDGSHQYANDAEGRATSVDSGAATYVYDAAGVRVRKAVGSASAEYLYFAGQVLATRAQDGKWTDYISGPGGRIARAQDYDNGLRIYGTRCSNCGSQFMDYYLNNAGGLNNYTIQSGDKLYFTQYQLTGSFGGAVIVFSDGSNSNWTVKDKETYYLNDDQTQATTHFRTVDLSSLAGKTITQFALNQGSDTAPGAFAIIYEQMALVSADGTVHPIYTGQTTSPVSSMGGTSGITAAGSQIDVNTGHAIYPQSTTIYFGQDHLGSSRLVTNGFGYPIWQATFLPYGQEYNPQLGVDATKFTGLEHDDESGLDHASFRNYSSSQGRWLRPDPLGASARLADPQTLNRYTYVGNNPLTAIDRLGLESDCDFVGGCMDGDIWWGGDWFDSSSNEGSGSEGSNGQGSLGVGNPGYCPPSSPNCGGSLGGQVNGGGAGIAECGVDPFCRNSGGVNPFSSPIAQTHCEEFDFGTVCFGGMYQFSQYQIGGTYTVDWSAQINWTIQTGWDALKRQQDALAKALNVAPDQLNPVFLKGGNWNFSVAGQYSFPSDCAQGTFGYRCGADPSIHPNGGYLHLDTANPNRDLLGFLTHGIVDVVLGNTLYAGGIPR